MRIRKAHMILFIVLLAQLSFGFVDLNNYVYNGTDWVPLLATSDGQPYYQLNLLNITANKSITPQMGIGISILTQEVEVKGNISATQDVCIAGGFCLSSAGGTGMTSFNVSGDAGTDQIITQENTLTLDGVNSIVTTGAATDTIQIDIIDDSIDGTELADTITLDATLTITGNDINLSNTLYVNASANRIGLGMSDPDETLEVIGNQKISGYFNFTITNGNSRYFSNGCVEKVNSTGVHYIC